MNAPICTRRCAPSAFSARSSAAALLVVLLGASAAVWAQPAVDYRQAEELLGAGKLEAAATAFTTAADRSPDATWAADALFTAASLYEDQLAEPSKAEALYRRIIDNYPNARVSRAAELRGANLSALLGSSGDAKALAAWKALLRDYPVLDSPITTARDILAAHPSWSGRYQVRLWLGAQLRQLGRFRAAGAEFELAIEHARTDEERFAAQRRRIEIDVLLGRLDAAESRLASLDAGGHPGRQRVVADARRSIDRKRLRRRLYWASWLVMIASLLALVGSLGHAAGWRRLPAALWPIPGEAVYVLPVLGLLVAMSMTGHSDLAPAVAIIAAMGVALTWLSGAGLRAKAPSRMRVAVHVLCAVLGGLAAVYVAIHVGDLIDQIIETVRFGPDV